MRVVRVCVFIFLGERESRFFQRTPCYCFSLLPCSSPIKSLAPVTCFFFMNSPCHFLSFLSHHIFFFFNQSTHSGSTRLRSELAELSARPPPGYRGVVRTLRSVFHWVAVLQVGQGEGPLQGGVFELSMQMPFDYPVGSPLIKVVPPIASHPRVDPRTGEVLGLPWVSGNEHKSRTISEALESVRALLVILLSLCLFFFQ